MSFPSQIYNQFDGSAFDRLTVDTSTNLEPCGTPYRAPGTRNHEVEKIHFIFPDTGKKVGALFGFAFIGEKRVTDNAIMFRAHMAQVVAASLDRHV